MDMFDGAATALSQFFTAFVYSNGTIGLALTTLAGGLACWGVGKKLYTIIKSW